MEMRKLALLILLGSTLAPARSSANQACRNARRRHDLKLLSLRGETTPRTPVWRSKS